jgi:excisionase family DNA binding protein
VAGDDHSARGSFSFAEGGDNAMPVSIESTNLVTFTEAARMLGVSRPTVYNLVARGKLRPVTIGRNRYLLRQEVEAVRHKGI